MPPVPTDYPNVVTRYISSGAMDFDFGFIRPTGADTIWSGGPKLLAGETASGTAQCAVATTYSVAFYAMPTTPTSYTGANSYRSTSSDLHFLAPGEAQYVANIALSSGAIEVVKPGQPVLTQRLASSGQFALGTLEAGQYYFTLSALEGPQAAWSAQIYALPVALSEVAFSAHAIEPGKFVHLMYTLSGETKLTAVIYNSHNRIVRELASNFTVKRGSHSLSWGWPQSAGTSASRRSLHGQPDD